MRLIFATILTAIMASSGANASSIVVLGEINTQDSPSIVVLGEKSPSIVTAAGPDSVSPSIERFGGENPVPRNFVTVSASVIAMIDAPQPVALENVASIGGNDRKRRDLAPMVIRGGIVGDAFSSRSAPASNGAATPPPQQQVSAPPGGGSGSSRKEPEAPEPDQRLPKSALPPAAPTGRME